MQYAMFLFRSAKIKGRTANIPGIIKTSQSRFLQKVLGYHEKGLQFMLIWTCFDEIVPHILHSAEVKGEASMCPAPSSMC